MDLLPTIEQQQLVDTISKFLATRLPVDRLRIGSRAESSEHTMWRDLAELGLFGLGLPSELSGVGYTIIEEMLIFECFGRFLLSPVLLATLLAARIAASAGNKELVGSIIGGDSRAALAIPAHNSGRVYLIDAAGADLLVLWNRERAYLLGLNAAADVEKVTAMDETITLDRARVTTAAALAQVSCSDDAIDRRASILVSAMLVGVAEAALEMATGYAKTREQFGRPIGTFQAIKHKCADMALGTEAARALTAFAAVLDNDRRSDSAYHAAAAKLLATEAALNNAAVNIQIHGAMRYSAECNAHLFLKRARLLDQVGGNVMAQRALVLAEARPD